KSIFKGGILDIYLCSLAPFLMPHRLKLMHFCALSILSFAFWMHMPSYARAGLRWRLEENICKPPAVDEAERAYVISPYCRINSPGGFRITRLAFLCDNIFIRPSYALPLCGVS